MFINTQYRTDKVEIMDDFAFGGDILHKSLNEIAKINQLLGGNQLTLQGVQKLIDKVPKAEKITIIDIGCGNGDMLRKLADYGNRNKLNFELIGVDANNYTIQYAQKSSTNYPNIVYQSQNVFNEQFQELEYDIALFTLTLHHFTNNEIHNLLPLLYRNTKIGIVVNDLHRSALAYRLFQVVCTIFRLGKMSREDGLISILRGFKKEELINISKKLNFDKYSVNWKWAFRYQWVIDKRL